MNPQQAGGLPPQSNQGPNLPPVSPNPAQPQPWAAPAGSSVPISTGGSPEAQYGQTAPHPAGQQYDFILSSEKAARKSALPGSNSMMGRILVALGGVVVLVILAAVVMSLLGGKSGDVTTLTAVAQDQTEIARIAQLAIPQATSQTVKNSTINIQLSINSADQQLLTYMATIGYKLGNQQLRLKQDSRTDTQLKAAADASNFDSTFVSIMQTQLATYQHDLKAAYAMNPGPNGKVLLSDQYKGAGLLLTQLTQK